MGKFRGDCTTLAEAGLWYTSECCTTCHRDAEDGYSDLGYLLLPNGDWVNVCCGTWMTLPPGQEILDALDKRESE